MPSNPVSIIKNQIGMIVEEVELVLDTEREGPGGGNDKSHEEGWLMGYEDCLKEFKKHFVRNKIMREEKPDAKNSEETRG